MAASSIEVGPTLPAQIVSAAAHKKSVVPVQLERFGARVGACDIPDSKHGCVGLGQPAVAGGQHDAAPDCDCVQHEPAVASHPCRQNQHGGIADGHP